MRRDTAGLACSRTLSELGIWASAVLSRRVPGLEGGGRDAVPSTAAILRSILLLPARGVIADFGDDADWTLSLLHVR